jgi:hypothetical protein
MRYVKLTEEDIKRLVKKTLAEQENHRYMFFSNLEQIHRQTEILLNLNENELEQLLDDGHDWAQDHIATAKESIDQVFDFIMNKVKGNYQEESNIMMEGKKKSGTKLCARGKTAAKAKYKIFPSAFANGYAVQVCQGKKPGLDGKKRCSAPYC